MELYNKSKRKFPTIGKICGFPENAQLDSMIHFWLEFWKQQGLKYPQDLTPRLIKAMIAKESSFNPRAQPKDPKMTARGLMQIKKDTWEFLGGAKKADGLRELSSQHVFVSQDDLFDPLTNVACGTRWLARKYQLIPKNTQKNAFNNLKAYNTWEPKGEAYAK
jgi:soluble lytic murein transglycosylase-like protein